MTQVKRLPSPEQLVPHKAPMLLLDSISDVDEVHINAKASVAKDNPFLVPGAGLLPSALIEMVAQASAAIMGYNGYLQGAVPPMGYLVSVKDTSIDLDRPILEGTSLEIEANLDNVMGDFAWYKGDVRLEDTIICTTTLMVFKEKSSS
ncbi:MAG: hypothetical protein GXP49_09350 [Deltaproteobacteria bacterium]|nr:hypothetical protein [Deltaproteobacteria bacterium]